MGPYPVFICKINKKIKIPKPQKNTEDIRVVDKKNSILYTKRAKK